MTSLRLRTRHDLESVAVHFFYEVTQMREALAFWKSGVPALHRFHVPRFCDSDVDDPVRDGPF